MEDVFRVVLVLLRVSALFAVLPIFGMRTVPARIKVVIRAALSFDIAAGLPDTGEMVLRMDLRLILLAAREVAIGVTLGFLASLISRGVELGGEIIGT